MIPQLSHRTAGTRVLVIDDDPPTLDLLRRVLERNGLEPLVAATAAAGLRILFEERPDLVLLDLGLPDSGGGALTRIRELSDVPVVIVSAVADQSVKVQALRAGADDYVVKPFGLQELVARIETLLRRAGATATLPSGSYSDGLVEIDRAALEVKIAGAPVELTALELRLLVAFTEHPSQVLSPTQLLERVWGDASLSRERVKLYVGYLRGKFRSAGVEAPIETMRGFGYRYRPPAG
jgi:DNA-binding response OmpR family regulator